MSKNIEKTDFQSRYAKAKRDAAAAKAAAEACVCMATLGKRVGARRVDDPYPYGRVLLLSPPCVV